MDAGVTVPIHDRLAMREITDRVKALTNARRALWTGGLFSVGIGAVFYLVTARSVESDAQQRFANQALIAQSNIDARIKSYSDLLRAAASMFHANAPISRSTFHDFVIGLKLPQQFPAVEVINYAEFVLDQDREKIEQRLRREYGDEIGKGRSSLIMPPGRRPSYSILTVAEPTWLGTIGIDVGGRPEVRPTVRRMIDTGDFVHSGIPIEAITGPNRIGLGIRLPIYRAGVPTNTVDERRAAYIGSMGIAVSVPKLVKDVLQEMRIKNVRMTLIDASPGPQALMLPALAGGRLLFDSVGTEHVPAPPLNFDTGEYFSETVTTKFQGRLWKVIFSTGKTDFYTGFDAYFPWLAMMFGMISAALLYALFHTLSSSRQRALAMAEEMTSELRDNEAELKRSHEQLRRLAAHAEQIKEVERKRIAREIHDDLGQNLLALRIEAEMLSSRTAANHPRLHQRASWTLLQIDATIKSVRQIINDLRPNVLDLGLAAAVEWQIAEFKRRTGIACTLAGDDLDRADVNDHCATAFFRILQESLNNIARHAKATHVRVELKLDTLEPYRLSMTVADNGIGMPANGLRPGSFGLVGIEERVKLLHGTFLIHSKPGAGTILSVSIPLNMVPSPDTIIPDSSPAQALPVV
jgi:signal transduction histidine kinase